jgi:hypothetical protein
MNKRQQLYILAVALLVLFLFLISFKEGMLQMKHAVDVSGILQDVTRANTKIQMISMIGINEPEDPLFYNLLINNDIDPVSKVETMNKMIEQYFSKQ